MQQSKVDVFISNVCLFFYSQDASQIFLDERYGRNYMLRPLSSIVCCHKFRSFDRWEVVLESFVSKLNFFYLAECHCW